MLYINTTLTLQESRYLAYLSDFFHIPINSQVPQNSAFLVWENQTIALKIHGHKNIIFADFTNHHLMRRANHHQRELMVKAINLKKYNSIWDATAGLGKDAFLLASFGARVTLFERHPLIAALLWDGLQRAKKNKLLGGAIERMRFIYGSITDHNLSNLQYPDVIYLDPMFPPRKKSAQVKQEMVFLQKAVGSDLDDTQLLSQALCLPVFRVVIKRNKLAPCIHDMQPSFSIRGRSTRFDVYVNNQ